jgi:hypothetical protein
LASEAELTTDDEQRFHVRIARLQSGAYLGRVWTSSFVDDLSKKQGRK